MRLDPADPDQIPARRKSVVFFVPVTAARHFSVRRIEARAVWQNITTFAPPPSRAASDKTTRNMPIRHSLQQYIETHILPLYDAFDRAHRRDHALHVINRATALAERLGADVETAYAAAAYHDTGLAEGRELHHEVSARIVRDDANLRQWFTDSQIDTIACAAEDHRASAARPPRSIYGCIVAEADRAIDPETIVRRTVQYGLANYPGLSREEQWVRTTDHLQKKYAEGGYLRLWLAESPNAGPLAQLRKLIADTERLRALFDSIYDNETAI